MKNGEIHDAVIVGGGPAGLSAALLLGRCMRKVVLIDAGRSGLEVGMISPPGGESDGCSPSEFLRAGREQLAQFATVTYCQADVDDIERNGIHFTAHCSDGEVFNSRALLLASDFVARTPPIPGADRFYGSSLHQCPYCDGWEHRGRHIGVLGADAAAMELALKLLQWSSRVVVYTNGGQLEPAYEKRLEKAKVRIVQGKVIALDGEGKDLEQLVLEDGTRSSCEALFYCSARRYHTSLAARLGCDLERIHGALHWRSDGDTGIEGLFAAGSVTRTDEMTVIAAGEGLKAAGAVNDWLLEADQSYLAARNPPPPPPRTSRPITSPRRRVYPSP